MVCNVVQSTIYGTRGEMCKHAARPLDIGGKREWDEVIALFART